MHRPDQVRHGLPAPVPGSAPRLQQGPAGGQTTFEGPDVVAGGIPQRNALGLAELLQRRPLGRFPEQRRRLRPGGEFGRQVPFPYGPLLDQRQQIRRQLVAALGRIRVKAAQFVLPLIDDLREVRRSPRQPHELRIEPALGQPCVGERGEGPHRPRGPGRPPQGTRPAVQHPLVGQLRRQSATGEPAGIHPAHRAVPPRRTLHLPHPHPRGLRHHRHGLDPLPRQLPPLPTPRHHTPPPSRPAHNKA